MNDRRRIPSGLIAVVAVTVVALVVFALGARYLLRLPFRQIEARRQALVYQVNHDALLEACRELQANYAQARATKSWPTDHRTLWPEMLRQLNPSDVSRGSGATLYIEFGGGFHHFGYVVFPTDDERPDIGGMGWAWLRLRDGLWYYDEAALPPKP